MRLQAGDKVRLDFSKAPASELVGTISQLSVGFLFDEKMRQYNDTVCILRKRETIYKTNLPNDALVIFPDGSEAWLETAFMTKVETH